MPRGLTWSRSPVRIQHIQEIFYKLGHHFRRQGEVESAISYFEESTRGNLALLDPVVLAYANLNLGNLYSALEMHPEALNCARLAVSSLQEFLEEHDIARAMHIGGVTLSEGERDVVTALAVSYHNIGVEEEYFGKADHALSSFRKGYDLVLNLFGPDHPMALQLKANLYDLIPTLADTELHDEQTTGTLADPIHQNENASNTSHRKTSPRESDEMEEEEEDRTLAALLSPRSSPPSKAASDSGRDNVREWYTASIEGSFHRARRARQRGASSPPLPPFHPGSLAQTDDDLDLQLQAMLAEDELDPSRHERYFGVVDSDAFSQVAVREGSENSDYLNSAYFRDRLSQLQEVISAEAGSMSVKEKNVMEREAARYRHRYYRDDDRDLAVRRHQTQSNQLLMSPIRPRTTSKTAKTGREKERRRASATSKRKGPKERSKEKRREPREPQDSRRVQETTGKNKNATTTAKRSNPSQQRTASPLREKEKEKEMKKEEKRESKSAAARRTNSGSTQRSQRPPTASRTRPSQSSQPVPSLQKRPVESKLSSAVTVAAAESAAAPKDQGVQSEFVGEDTEEDYFEFVPADISVVPSTGDAQPEPMVEEAEEESTEQLPLESSTLMERPVASERERAPMDSSLQQQPAQQPAQLMAEREEKAITNPPLEPAPTTPMTTLPEEEKPGGKAIEVDQSAEAESNPNMTAAGTGAETPVSANASGSREYTNYLSGYDSALYENYDPADPVMKELQEKLRDEKEKAEEKEKNSGVAIPPQEQGKKEKGELGSTVVSPESESVGSKKKASRRLTTRLSLGTDNDAVPTQDLENLISLAAEFHNIHLLEGDAKKEAIDLAFSKLKGMPTTEQEQYLVSIRDRSRPPSPRAECQPTIEGTATAIPPEKRQLRRLVRVDSVKDVFEGEERLPQTRGNRVSVRVETPHHAEALHNMLDLAVEMKQAEKPEDVERLLDEMGQAFEDDKLNLQMEYDLDDGNDTDLDIDEGLLADLDTICG